MEIIGEAGEKFIISATKSEFAKVAGYSSQYDDRARGFGLGTVVNVSGIFDSVQMIRDGATRAKAVVQKITEVSTSLEAILKEDMFVNPKK